MLNYFKGGFHQSFSCHFFYMLIYVDQEGKEMTKKSLAKNNLHISMNDNI